MNFQFSKSLAAFIMSQIIISCQTKFMDNYFTIKRVKAGSRFYACYFIVNMLISIAFKNILSKFNKLNIIITHYIYAEINLSSF